MSSTGGGIVARISRNAQVVAHNSDFTKYLTLINSSSSEVDLSQSDIDGLASTYCPDPNTTVGLTKYDAGWSVTTAASP